MTDSPVRLLAQHGQPLREGCWYILTEVDEPGASLRAGTEVLCKSKAPGCIDPENHWSDGLNVEWFADYLPEEGRFDTLVFGCAFIRGPKHP